MLDREKVGKAIAEQRKGKGMTQRQLADLMHVSYQAVSRWEQGLSLPSVDLIYDMAKVLGTTVDFFLSGLSQERKIISYLDSGLDVKRLHRVKERLSGLVTSSEELLHVQVADPVFFQADLSGMEEPVWVFANQVPGSKEGFAREHGYDREICVDLVSNAANNLMRFGVKPMLLQAQIVCGNNDGSQLLLMGEALKEACVRSGIIFGGLEVAAQAVNYRADQYQVSAFVTGVTDRRKIITGEAVGEGDILLGLCTDGISSVSYPFIKVILERRPDILYRKICGQCTVMEELTKPNACFVHALEELGRESLLHGVFLIDRSLFNRRCYRSMPRGLGAAIAVSSIPVPPLFQCLYDLGMMDRECFLENFSLGVGMVMAVPEDCCDRAKAVVEKYHKCCVIGKVEKDEEDSDARVWMKGRETW